MFCAGGLLYSRMKPFFGWCAKAEIGKLKLSPMLGLDQPFAEAKRRERPWFKGATGNEAIKTLWAVADKLGGVRGQYLKVLLLTGKRKSALAEMRWEQIERKIPQHIRDRLFDHAEGRGSGAIYDHHEYETEMRNALDKRADHIMRLVQPAEGVERLR